MLIYINIFAVVILFILLLIFNFIIMKKIKLIILLSFLLCAITIIGYKSYGHTVLSRMEFMVANIESIANQETGIKLEFCFESGSSGSLSTKPECAPNTDVTYGTPSIPMGTIYPCKDQVGGGLKSKLGYCYNPKK